MTPLALGGVIFAVALILLATGMPIAFALGSTALIFMLWTDGFDAVMYMADTVFSGLDDFTLASIPMFIIMGAAVASSRAGSDLYEALNRWLYKVPGSLVISNIGACALFSALTGSSPATCAAIGKMGIPEMRRRGYAADLATGSIAAGGTLGILIPPSVTMILYGIASETSIGRLFIAGILPGLMLTGLFIAWALFLSWRRGTTKVSADVYYSWAQRFELLPRLLPLLGGDHRRDLCALRRDRNPLRGGGRRRRVVSDHGHRHLPHVALDRYLDHRARCHSRIRHVATHHRHVGVVQLCHVLQPRHPEHR